MRGWFYVISNKSLPNLVKIGFSTKDPILRASEFNGTGVPFNFEVLYDALVINPRDVEQKVHKHLSNYRENKEWFRTSLNIAVEAINLFADDIISEKFHAANEVDTKIIKEEKCKIKKIEDNKCNFYMYQNCCGELKSYKGVYYCAEHLEKERKKRFSIARAMQKNTL